MKMNVLKNKVVLVTGASSGIGAGIVKELLEEGMKVVGLARRVEKVEALRKGHEDHLFPIKADVTDKNDLERVFTWIQANLGPIHALINNAGVMRPYKIDEQNIEDVEAVINTNLLATTLYTGKAIESMKANDIDGTIININSVAGHYIIKSTGLGIYQASKFGVTAFTECIRKDLAQSGSKIRISSVSPGLVESEMTEGFLQNPYIRAKDVANTVKFILAQPPEVHITELTIRPTGEEF